MNKNCLLSLHALLISFLLFLFCAFKPVLAQSETDTVEANGAFYWAELNRWAKVRQWDSTFHYAHLASTAYFEEENYIYQVEALNAMGACSYRLDKLTAAKIWWDSAWSASQIRLKPSDATYRRALLNQGVLMQENENMLGAIELYRSVLDQNNELKTRLDSSYRGYDHLNLGTALTEINEKDESLYHLQEALRLFDLTGVNPLDKVRGIIALAKVFAETPYTDSARYFLLQGYELIQPYDQKQFAGYHDEVLSGLASYHYIQEDLDSAEYYMNKALALPVPVGSRRAIRQSNLQASLYTKQGKYQEAEQILLSSRDTLKAKEEVWNPFLYSRVHYRLGNVARESGQWQKAIDYYNQSLDILTHGRKEEDVLQKFMSNSSTIVIYTFAYLGKCQEKLGKFSEAKEAYQTATSLIKESFHLLEFESSRFSLFETLRWAYEGYLDVLWAAYEQDSDMEIASHALLLAEESRSYLMRLIFAEAEGKLAAGIPESIIQQEKDFRSKLSSSKAALSTRLNQSEPNYQEVDSLESLILQQQEGLRRMIKQFEKDYPQYAEVKYNSSSFTERQLKQLLSDKANDYWISFWGDSSTFIFQIRDGQLSWERQKRRLIEPLLDNVLSSLREPSDEQGAWVDFARQSSQLKDGLSLFTPENNQTLVLVLDGPLNFLPFEALCQSESGSDSWGSLGYLGRSIPMRYQYTLASIHSSSKRGIHKAWGGFAPEYEGLDKMRFNKSEVENISDLLGGDKWMGSEASKSSFLAQANQFEVIHFAGHARANTKFPMRSTLEFGSSESEKLYAWEIYNLQLSAKLAVLSGCETGLGRYQAGEGVIGLARAFRYAGVNNLMQSLWLADGQATQELMGFFYKEMQHQDQLASSLKHARQKFLDETPERFHHPYYWSNFVLVGPDQEKDGFPYVWLLGLGVLLLLGLAFVALRKREA